MFWPDSLMVIGLGKRSMTVTTAENFFRKGGLALVGERYGKPPFRELGSWRKPYGTQVEPQ